MVGDSASKQLQVDIDSDKVTASYKHRFSDNLKTCIINQSLGKLESAFTDEYRFRINRVHIYDDRGAEVWHIHAVTDYTGWSFSDFELGNIRGITHEHDEDILRVEMQLMELDETVSEVHQRVCAEIAEEVADNTRFDSQQVSLHHTTFYAKASDGLNTVVAIL